MPEHEGRLETTWEVLYKDDEGQGHVVPLHKYDHTPEGEDLEDLLVRQGPPLRITPSKRARVEHEADERILGIGDIHFPFHDQDKLGMAMVALKARNPDTIVLLGDNLDYAMFSRFETREEWHGSTQEGIDKYAEFLAQLRADHPFARIIWHEGNHDQRAEKQLRNYNGELLGIKRAGEQLAAMSLAFLVRADELGVETITGYPSSKENHRGLLDTYHGRRTMTNGLAASKVIMEATTSFMTGHTHQVGMVERTFQWRGEEVTIHGVEAGTFADPNLIPSGQYAPGQLQEQNWQSGVPGWDLYDELGIAIPSIDQITQYGVSIDGRIFKS